MKNFFLAITIAFTFSANAQSVAINNDGSTADNSAILDLKSNNQGVLVPRMTAAQRGLIATPATGLMVYQTDAPAGFYFYNGTAWSSLNGAAGANGTNGTNGTNGANGQGVPTGGTANQVLAKLNATDFNTQWVTPSGAKLELRVTKNTTQALVVSTSPTPDLVTYESIVTAPTLGSYANNAYTVGANGAGLYLIQTRNSMIDSTPTANNTIGAYNFLEVNGSAYGSITNIYPSYVSNVSLRSVTNVATRSSTQYMFLINLNAGDVIRIRATSSNTSNLNVHSLSNDGGTQLMVVKL